MANNRQVAHSFVYGNSANGSSFSTDGGTLWSYSSILARKFNIDGQDIILVSDSIRTYSNTSQKHHSHLQHAFSGQDDIIYINEVPSHYTLEECLDINEFKYKLNNIVDLYKKQSRARKTDYSYWINKELEELELFLKYGNIDKRSAEYKQYKKIVDNTDIDKIVADSIEAEKKYKQALAKRNYEIYKERFTKFTGVKCNYKPNELQGYNYLKTEDDKLCTNSWVKVDLDSARKLYKAFKKGINIVGQKIEHYTILQANKVSVKIGCHNILVKELDRVLGA